MRTFPVFLDVTGRPPLIFGGSDLTAAKARLLSRRAETVEVAATAPDQAVRELASTGHVTFVDLEPTIASIRARPLVIATTGDDERDAEISAIARSLGVPVNVPDRPELCTFILPAIVDRGDVIIAIGTEGRSPVLAQRLRAWLERELHPQLGALARLAGEFRDRVASTLPAGPRRRQLWEKILDGDAAKAVYDGRETAARELITEAIDNAGSAQPARARVILVGAGPGDPDLLTLKAVRALKSADVILYDDLVAPAILDLARREATLISVGKRGGRPSTKQATIHERLLEHAQPGTTTVRLKGGDPFVFGRGGEEIAALRQHDIDVDVVPGITAAVAAAASVQIPLTDRRLSRTVTFLSGHGPGHGLPEWTHVDLRALSGGGHTLAVYMAVATARSLGEALVDAGWRSDCPVLAIENASRASERRVRGTIGDLSAADNALGLDGPAVLIVGDVAGLEVKGIVTEISTLEPSWGDLAYA